MFFLAIFTSKEVLVVSVGTMNPYEVKFMDNSIKPFFAIFRLEFSTHFFMYFHVVRVFFFFFKLLTFCQVLNDAFNNVQQFFIFSKIHDTI